ncbi:MAG TPA: hypothetical protein VNK04_13070 [Gemmataceae bacterium]|jgi:hypothetical protein|nr:hypothetical protein [Gemmataceae bacterium]
MKRFVYSVLALTAPLENAADRPVIPPLDRNPPAKTETATFAVG